MSEVCGRARRCSGRPKYVMKRKTIPMLQGDIDTCRTCAPTTAVRSSPAIFAHYGSKIRECSDLRHESMIGIVCISYHILIICLICYYVRV